MCLSGQQAVANGSFSQFPLSPHWPFESRSGAPKCATAGWTHQKSPAEILLSSISVWGAPKKSARGSNKKGIVTGKWRTHLPLGRLNIPEEDHYEDKQVLISYRREAKSTALSILGQIMLRNNFQKRAFPLPNLSGPQRQEENCLK